MFLNLNSRSLRTRPYLSNRRQLACFRFPNLQDSTAIGIRRAIRGRTKPSRPYYGPLVRQDRPMPALPYRYTRFLEKSFDLLLSRTADGLVLVPWPPITQNHAAGQTTP